MESYGVLWNPMESYVFFQHKAALEKQKSSAEEISADFASERAALEKEKAN